VKYKCDTGDRRRRQHHQLEKARRRGDRGSGDDVADRTHQRNPSQQKDQAWPRIALCFDSSAT
jgi:hypothetical protein